MTIAELFKDWIIPIGSMVVSLVNVGIAIWFASSAKSDAAKAQNTLDSVDSAIEGWQKQIMASTVGILDSMPQVVEGKATLAKVEAAKALTQGIQDAIHEIARNPQPGAAGHTQEQNLRALTEHLNSLLSTMTSSGSKENVTRTNGVRSHIRTNRFRTPHEVDILPRKKNSEHRQRSCQGTATAAGVFAGVLYHATARGDRREDIYLDDADREDFLALLCYAEFEAKVRAYRSGAYTVQRITDNFGMHYPTLSRAV